MKNNKIKTVFNILLGIIIGTGMTAYASYSYYAKDISFTPTNEEWKVNNIEDALNDIYGKSLNFSNLTFINSSVNTRAVWSGAANTLTTNLNLSKGNYIITITGNTSTQAAENISGGSTDLNVENTLLNTIVKSNFIAHPNNSNQGAHGKTINSVYLVKLSEDTTVTASYTSGYAMQQHIIMQAFQIN